MFRSGLCSRVTTAARAPVSTIRLGGCLLRPTAAAGVRRCFASAPPAGTNFNNKPAKPSAGAAADPAAERGPAPSDDAHVAEKLAYQMGGSPLRGAKPPPVAPTARRNNVIVALILAGFVSFVYVYSARKVTNTDDDFDAEEIKAVQKELDAEKELSRARAIDAAHAEASRLALLAKTVPPAGMQPVKPPPAPAAAPKS